MADDFVTVAAKFDKFADDLAGRTLSEALGKLGQAAKKDADEAVRAESSKRGSLADASMSGWRRGSPIEISARYDVTSDHEVEVAPNRRTRGLWRVLEEGRVGGSAFDMVLVGRTRKDGTRRGRSRGRNVGETAGKGTWSDAERLIEDRTPKRVEAEVSAALRRRFRGA